MGALTCRIPVEIELRGMPGQGRLDELEDTLAELVAERLATANRAISSREGWPDFHRTYAAPQIEFVRGEPDAPLRRLVSAAVEAAIARALTSVSPGSAAPTVNPLGPSPLARRRVARRARRVDPGTPWVVHKAVKFHARPRDFIKLYARSIHATAADLDLSEVYFELLDERQPAVAWVIELGQERELVALLKEVEASYSAKQPEGTTLAVGGDHTVRSSLVRIDLDGVIESAIPDFLNPGLVYRDVTGDGKAGQTLLAAGTWIFVAFQTLPEVDVNAITELTQQPFSLQMKIADLDGLVAATDFEAELHLPMGPILTQVPDALVTIWIMPFKVRKKVHARAVAALLGEDRYRRHGVRRLGRIVPLDTIEGQQALPQPVRDALSRLPARDAQSPKARHPASLEIWEPGRYGASISVVFPPDLAKRRLGAEKSAEIDKYVGDLRQILAIDDGFWSGGDRATRFRIWINSWERRNPLLFELVLDRLDQAGMVDQFFTAVADLRGLFDPMLWRIVIGLVTGGPYAGGQAFRKLLAQMNAGVADVAQHRYDVAQQTVWFGDTPVKASGAGAAGNAGVIAMALSVYSEEERTHELRPHALERLKGDADKYLTDYLRRQVCGGSEARDAQQLMQEALQHAAKHATPPIGEADVHPVKVITSVRIIKIETTVEGGVTETRVTYQDVRKVGERPWQAIGSVQYRTAAGFEARLKSFTLKHAMRFLTVVALAEMALIGGFFVIEAGIASLGELIFFVALETVTYYFHTAAEDRTIEGYLTAVLKAELQLVGFKFASGLAKGASQGLTRGLLSQKLITDVSAKWVLLGLKATLTAAGVGALEMLEQLAEDLVKFHHCGDWSEASVYWKRFGNGFFMTLAFELVAVQFLTPPLRAALEKAGSVRLAARALRASGMSLSEVTRVLLKGSEQMETALERNSSNAGIKALARSFGTRTSEYLRAVKLEYQAGAYHSLFEFYGKDLGSEGASGLRKLLSATGEAETDRLLQKIMTAGGSHSRALEALGNIDEKVLKELVASGQLVELGISPRALKFLSSQGSIGGDLLRGPFKSSVRNFDDFLGRLDELPTQAGEDVLAALAREGNSLSPELLLKAAGNLGGLDGPTVALLGRLDSAGVLLEPLVGRSAASMRNFMEEFGGFGDDIQRAALEGAEGKTPDAVLQRARDLEAKAKASKDAQASMAETEARQALEAEGKSGGAPDKVELEAAPDLAGSPEPRRADLEELPEFEPPPAVEPSPGVTVEPRKGGNKKAGATQGKPGNRRKKAAKKETASEPLAAGEPPALSPKTRPPAKLDPQGVLRGQAQIQWYRKQVLIEQAFRDQAAKEFEQLRVRLLKDTTLSPPEPRNFHTRTLQIERLKARPGKTRSEAQKVRWQEYHNKQLIALYVERLQRTEAIVHANSVAIPALEKLIAQARSKINTILRSYGPNYNKLYEIPFDEIMGSRRWQALVAEARLARKPLPRLENEHIVSIKRITELPEMNELLEIYATASIAEQAAIVERIKMIGDRPYNLKRMSYDVNRKKLDRKWETVSIGEVREYGYTQADLDKLVKAEADALPKLQREILTETSKWESRH